MISRALLLGLIIGLGILSVSVILWYNPELAESLGITIFRGWVKLPCENASAPKCSGACPESQICVASDDFCYCIEDVKDTGCGKSYPQCDAACPQGYACKRKESSSDPRCYCEKVLCSQATGPDCNGVCDEGSCSYNEQVGKCECKSAMGGEEGGNPGNKTENWLTPCVSTVAPTCGGFCNPGYECAEVQPGNCGCRAITTEYCAGSYPTCMGDCGSGRGCIIDTDEQKCKCVVRAPETPTGAACGDSSWPYCSGVCPEGMTCIDNEETAACVKDIFCYCDFPAGSEEPAPEEPEPEEPGPPPDIIIH